MIWRAIVAAVGGFAVGYAYREKRIRDRERQMRHRFDNLAAESIDDLASSTLPDEIWEPE